jgi:type II restriction/modification system DNA methylase subunit YeeA
MSNLNEESSNDLKETKSNNTSPEMLTQSAVKDFLMSRGGQVKYSELFEQFRNSISDSTNDDLFQEYILNIATKRTEDQI